MKIKPNGNFGEGCQGFAKQKRHKHKKHKQWQRFKRKRTKHFGGFSKFNDCPNMPIMNPSSFWDNYANVFKWQQNYYTSYWKSKAITLENEVHHLRAELNKYRHKNNPSNDSSDRKENEDDCILVESDDCEQLEEQPVQAEEEDDEIYDEDDDIGICDFEIVVSDEMQEYLNKKAEGKSHKSGNDNEIIIDESENNDSEEEIIFEKENNYRSKRNVKSKKFPDSFCSDDDMIEMTADEKKKIYGIHSETINAMEIAVQLSYLTFWKKTNPSYWPNLPLVIKFD